LILFAPVLSGVEALAESFTRNEWNDTRQLLDKKKAERNDRKQKLEALEDELRRAGLRPRWAREP
jgi:hypothetical protein